MTEFIVNSGPADDVEMTIGHEVGLNRQQCRELVMMAHQRMVKAAMELELAEAAYRSVQQDYVNAYLRQVRNIDIGDYVEVRTGNSEVVCGLFRGCDATHQSPKLMILCDGDIIRHIYIGELSTNMDWITLCPVGK